jgi:PAS domain S-box-containing protein
VTPLSIAYVAAAAIFAVVGLEHLVVGVRVRERRVYMLFGSAALAAAVDALVQRQFALAATPAEFESLFAWSAVSICTFLVLFLWFIEARTDAVRRWLLVVETALLTATATLDFVLPAGAFATMDVTAVRDAVLPWGEVFRRAVGETSPWRVVGDVANVGFLVLLLDTTIRLIRGDRRREARLIGASMIVLALSVLAIIPMDLGFLDLPSLHPFAFLLIVAIMAWDLSYSAVRAADLSREVIASERRWRQVLENVQLLAVGIDTEGRIAWVNPFVLDVTGYGRDELVGRHIAEMLPDDVRDDALASFARNIAGNVSPEVERPITIGDGSRREVVWRTVLLRDASGGVEGVLSLGADVTEHRRSAEELERAAAELEATVVELEAVRAKLEEENVYLKEEIDSRIEHSEIIGSSDALLYVLHKIRQVAPTHATVLIQGETGVGKELVANAIHDASDRASGPFVVVNCAALPPGLIESELFGHEKGAFTGADRQRRGRFELAHRGTIFLDEVGEVPLEMQPKLLRVLQEGEIERVGGSQTIPVDVRVIAATNRELKADIVAGGFREDLFYRISVFPITVPPLRDRRDDIPSLVQHFTRHFARRRGRDISEIPAEVMRRLESYQWPGNVRELQNVIERAVLTSTGGVLKLAEPLLNDFGKPVSPDPPEMDEGLMTLADLERRHIERVLASTRGKISGPGGAAEVLGLHANTLRYRMKKLGISAGRRNPEAPSDR